MRTLESKLLDPAGSSKEKPKTAGDNFTQVLQCVENSLIHDTDEKSLVAGDSSTGTVNRVASYCKLCRSSVEQPKTADSSPPACRKLFDS
ncbi:uncharacterized protein LOC112189023 isoform X2 [Rosa chinensis]|uniref:uncharacterized protein LOC112189023 isoform X2 n=1 Tax=Rosa chinensis TaxID=74649 RepID=UPI000D0968F2|nr:uncharacterized protein LOC112189023 isoform X2 [Rosa chinensis]